MLFVKYPDLGSLSGMTAFPTRLKGFVKQFYGVFAAVAANSAEFITSALYHAAKNNGITCYP